jgi:hypothetical protein
MEQAHAWSSGKAVSDALQQAAEEKAQKPKKDDSDDEEHWEHCEGSAHDSDSDLGGVPKDSQPRSSGDGGDASEEGVKRRRRSKGSPSAPASPSAAAAPSTPAAQGGAPLQKLGDGPRQLRDRNKNTVYQTMKAAGKIPKFVEQMIAKAAKGNPTRSTMYVFICVWSCQLSQSMFHKPSQPIINVHIVSQHLHFVPYEYFASHVM